MQVSQLINSSGNAVKNQFVITTDLGQYFKSYDSLIAFKPCCGSTVEVTKAWDYSSTTLKHLKSFLCCNLSKKQIQSGIKSGSLILNNSLTIK